MLIVLFGSLFITTLGSPRAPNHLLFKSDSKFPNFRVEWKYQRSLIPRSPVTNVVLNLSTIYRLLESEKDNCAKENMELVAKFRQLQNDNYQLLNRTKTDSTISSKMQKETSQLTMENSVSFGCFVDIGGKRLKGFNFSHSSLTRRMNQKGLSSRH